MYFTIPDHSQLRACRAFFKRALYIRITTHFLSAFVAIMGAACYSQEPNFVNLIVTNAGSNELESVHLLLKSKSKEFGNLTKSGEAAYLLFEIPVGTTNIIASWVEQGSLLRRSTTNAVPQSSTIKPKLPSWEVNISNSVVRVFTRTNSVPK
jgi:hypothetical protein